MLRIGAPSMRRKALRLPPSSSTATFSETPIVLAFATASSTIFCASSEEMLCFLTTLAIGPSPSFVEQCVERFKDGRLVLCFCALTHEVPPRLLNRGSAAVDGHDRSGHVAGARRG